MSSRFHDFWSTAADDGASCMAGVSAPRSDESDVDQLLDAWLRERTDRIECSLLLDEARRLVAGLLAGGEVSPRRRRRAGRFLQAVRAVQDRETRGQCD